MITSPDASRATLTRLIEQAVQSLAIEAEELTDPAIVAALLAARARGVAVTLVWPGPADAGAAFAKLAAAGATVRAVANPAIHAKVVVADARTLYVGSANSRPPRSTGTASSACGSTTPTPRSASPRPWRTTPPAASHRRRYIAFVWPKETP